MNRGTRNERDHMARLAAAESSLVGDDRADQAKRYVRSVMSEAVPPLEALNNLAYIVKDIPGHSETLQIYLGMMEGELARLNEITRRTLLFCKDAIE
jgi:hypothetical protein